MAKAARDPFDLTLNQEQREKLALWLSMELDNALNAKASADVEVEYWHMLYEQARTRSARNLPWADAADLTSYLPSEKVDALHARAMHTVFGPNAEPICTVEGWGEAADRAPFVEEFHQWKAEEERLKSECDRLLQIALIEPRGLIEVYEGSEYRTVRKEILAKLQYDPLTGGLVYDQDGNVQFEKDASDNFIEVTDQTTPAAKQVIDATENQRTGPQYRICAYADSLILPGHAREKTEIWGYAKRLFKRHTEIMTLATGPRAIYDHDTASQLTKTGDRETEAVLERAGIAVAPQDETTAEKELWETLLLIDLKAFYESWGIKAPRGMGEGARWYVATLHKDQHLLLRLQHDDIERGRFVPVILFPRPKRVTEGFSYVGNKLITVTEEHTAYRNMAADRSSMANAAPILRQVGSLWDPNEQPWGPKAVIDVRDPRELTVQQVADVPASVFQHIEMCERTAERLAGINDVASGQVSQTDRTLGEVQMATEQSFVRMDLVIGRFQEALEEIYQIRHAIHKRSLAEKKNGMEAPQSVIVGLEGRGVSIDEMMPDKRITAQLLEGAFRFKPHGSVSTADLGKQRGDFVSMIQFLPMLLQAFPMLALQFRSPQAARAMGREFVRLFRISNAQAFLGSPSQDLQQGLQGPMGMPMPGMMPNAGGGMMPPGMPPGGPIAPGGPSAAPPMQGLGPARVLPFAPQQPPTPGGQPQ